MASTSPLTPTASTGYQILEMPADAGPLADEALLAMAAHEPAACLWQAPAGLVVPRTYAARPGFAAVQADFLQPRSSA